jgi:hypothetical protein
MSFQSKKSSLLVLGLTSLVFSRAMFALFNDPEGPNLLIVIGFAIILFLSSLAVYSWAASASGIKRLMLSALVQAMIAGGAYLFLK